MFNPSLPRENIDAQAASTDGRATLYANGQTHMFGRKGVHKHKPVMISQYPKNTNPRFCEIITTDVRNIGG